MPKFRGSFNLQAVAASLLLVIAVAASGTSAMAMAGISGLRWLAITVTVGGAFGVFFGLSTLRTHAVKERVE